MNELNLLNRPWAEIERRERRLERLRAWLAVGYMLAGFLAGMIVGKLLL